jgi:hypothetical protein
MWNGPDQRLDCVCGGTICLACLIHRQVQCSVLHVVQCSAVQCSAVQCSAVQHLAHHGHSVNAGWAAMDNIYSPFILALINQTNSHILLQLV